LPYKLQGTWVDITRGFLDDSGSGAHMDVAVVVPPLQDGWYWVGQKATSHDLGSAPLPCRYLLVRPHPQYFGEPLAEYVLGPHSWQYVWGMTHHRLNQAANYGIWTPKQLPPGYVSLSDFFYYHTPPEFGAQGVARAPKAVALDCVTPVPIGTKIWDDRGSGAQDDGSIWRCEGDDSANWSFFRGHNHYEPPGGTGYRLNMDAIEII